MADPKKALSAWKAKYSKRDEEEEHKKESASTITTATNSAKEEDESISSSSKKAKDPKAALSTWKEKYSGDGWRTNRGTVETEVNKTSYLDTARNATKATISTSASKISAQDKDRRRKDLETELDDLNDRLRLNQQKQVGAMRGHASNLAKEAAVEYEEITTRISEINKELEMLDQPDMISYNDQLSSELEAAEERQANAQRAVSQYSGNAGGRALAALPAEEREALYKELNEANEAVAALSREQDQIEYLNEWQDAKLEEDTFWNQTKANYRVGRITQDTNEAFNDYIMNPTEENKDYAYALNELLEQYQENNAKILDDEGAKATWISKTAAGYVPQFLDQTKAQVAGGALGGLIGAAAGNPVTGIKLGASAASAMESYGQMRGAAYRALIAAGMDSDTALEAASDEAFVSALIEGVGTYASFMTLGGSKALNAIGNAALKSGSKNAAVKSVANVFGKSATDKLAKQAAKEVGKSTLRKGVELLGGLGLEAVSEYAEEASQESVSIANQNRENTGKWDLAKEAAGVIRDAVTGKNDEALSQIHEAGKEGAKISLMFGSVQTTTNTIVSKMANAKTKAERDTVVNEVLNDKESLSALIEEGKASGENSVSAKIAQEIENKVSSGKEVTKDDVRRLIVSNAEYIKAEEATQATEAPQSASERTMSTEAETPAITRNVQHAQASEATAGKQSVPYNVMSRSDTTRKGAAAPGYGEVGTRTFAEIVEESGRSADEVRAQFQTSYELGKLEMPREKVRFESTIQESAYNAGRQDAILSMKKAESKGATVWGKEGGLIQNEYSAKLDKRTTDTLQKIGKATGTKIVFDAQVGGGDANGAYVDSQGTIHIASDASNPVMVVVKHELTHRLQSLAPKEYTQFRNYAVQVMSEGRWDMYGSNTAVEAQQEKYYQLSKGRVNLTAEQAMDEIAADFTERILTDEKALNDFVTHVTSSKDAATRSMGQKFFQAVREFIDKVKRIFNGDKAKMDDAARDEYGVTIAQLEKAEQLWKEAYKAATEKAQSATKNTAQTDGEVQFSLKNVNGKQVVWIENSGFTNKQLNDHSFIAEYIAQHIGDVYTIIESGQKVYIGEDLPGEYTHSGYTSFLKDKKPQVLRAKNKAVSELGLLIETATNRRWEKTKHDHSKDAKYGMYRYDSAFAFPVKNADGTTSKVRAYDVELLIRNASDGKKYLYDIVGIKENTTDAIDLQQRETRRGSYEAAARGSASADNVTQQEDNVKSEAEEFSDMLTQFSLREKEPPKKVGIAYKVFYAKDGQLYPPMVANPGGAGTPVGVWLDADVAASAAPSKTGRPQVQAGGKGTNAGKMSLAFRPGWHLGDLPMATQFARKNPETGVKDLFPADFVWAECEYAMDHDYQEEAMSYGYTENGKFRHSYAGLPRLPEDGYYRYRTNPNPDTVPWVITGAMRVKRILTDAETDKILRDAGMEPMKRQGGELNLEKLGIKAGEQYSMKDNDGNEPTKKRDGKLFRTTENDGTTVLTTANDNPVAMMSEDGSAQFSLKTYEAFGRAELKRWLDLRVSKAQLDKADAADIVRQLDEYFDLCQNFLDKYAPFGAWSNAEVVRDNQGKPVFSVVKANGEYAMNLDFSLVCKKRRTLDAVFGEMIKRGMMDNVDLAEADIAKINEVIRESGFETACALCFVDAKRYRQAKVADAFVNQYNELVMKLMPEGGDVKAHYFDFVETGHYKNRGTGLHTLSNAELKPGIEKLKQVMRDNGSKTVPYKIAKHLLDHPQDRRLVNRGEFMNTDGFGAVRLKNPRVLSLYNSSKGSGGPKAAFSDVQYLGDILKKNNFTPGRAYAVGGVRIQSFSDYIPRLVFDYLQMVADLAAKKLPAHAYTKEATFVQQFGMTGIKMNMSLVPAVAEDGVAAGLDKNGNYYWFDGQSFGSDVRVKGSGQSGFELAIEIQNSPGYSEHCGTIAVGVSDEHIWKMLDDEDIRMIIPYHKSSLNHIVAVMNNIDKYTDYTNVQNTRFKDTGKKIDKKDFNFNEALRRTGDAKTAASEYLEWCEKNGYIPKFDTFAGHENYYKVLEDFSTYDNGVAAPQGPVTMTFPKKGDVFGSMAELIEQGLDEDAVLEGRRDKSLSSIVDKVEGVLKKREDVQYSLKDEDYMTAVENGDMETAQRMVNEAAKVAMPNSKIVNGNGTLKKVYHGSGNVFNVFDYSRLGNTGHQEGFGFYFADTKTITANYGNSREFYLDMQKPLYSDKRTITLRDLMKFMKALDPDGNGVISAYEDAGRIGYSTALRRAATAIMEYNDNDQDVIFEVANADGSNYEADVWLEFAKVLKDSIGYDGLISKWPAGEVYVVFDNTQMKLADAVTLDDNGNVLPLSERFNSENDDIRFSLKDQSDIMRDNAKLKEVNAALREQFKTTKFAKVDQKELRAFARKLLKDYTSDADLDVTLGKLDSLYTFLANDDPAAVAATQEQALESLANSKDEFSQPSKWSTAYRMAYEIAEGVIQDASVLNDDMYVEYEDLRKRLRSTGLSISKEYEHDLPGYEDLNDFRKRNFGRIKMTKDGLDVNTAYQELASTYPGLFDEYTYSHPADQLVHIAEVLDSMEPIEENPFSYNMREATSWLANDIMERFFELPQAKPTFADKAERKFTEQVIKDSKKLERVREQNRERVSKIISEYREKVKETRQKEKAAKWEAVGKVKEHYKAKEAKMSESRKARLLRERISRHVSDLKQKLLKPTDKKHIPQDLQGAVAKLLESINQESKYEYVVGEDGRTHRVERGTVANAEPAKRTKAFAELQAVYAQLANELTVDPDLLGDDGLLNDVIKLADKPLADMTSAELQIVWDTLRAVEATVRTANKIHNAARWFTVEEAATALLEDNGDKKEKTELRGILGKGQKLTGLDMETPETFFHLLGNAGRNLFRMMRNSQDQHIRLMKEVADFTHETLGNVNVRKLESDMHEVTLGGEKVKLSTAQIMELYVLSKREQAIDHIFMGGILPDVVSAKGLKKITKAKPVRGITLEEVGKAVNKLTKDQRTLADKLQTYASTTLGKWGNQTSMKVYGYEKFGEKNYWPIRVNRQEVKSDIQKDTAVTSLANRSFTKGTKPHANNSLRLGSIFDTFSTHASEMATYSAWLGTLEDINRIRNYTFRDEAGHAEDTVKSIIDTVHGTSGNTYLDKLLADVTNGVKGTHGETAYMSGLVGNFKAAAVGANLRVIIQQPTAMLRAADMIGAQYMAVPGNPLNGWKKALKYAPIAQWKDWGYFDINTGRQMKDVLFDSDTLLDKAKNLSMWGAGAMDSLAWGQLWNAVEAETKSKHNDFKPGSDSYYEAVAARFTEIVDHTQVVDGILQRSQIMRSADGITKMATSFMGEPTKQYNMMMQAGYDARTSRGKDRKAAMKKLARTATVLAISGIANAMAQSIIDAVRDDDKEEEYWEKLLSAFKKNLGSTFNPVAYVPFAKDIISILQGYDVTRMDMESIEKLVSAGQNMIKALSGEGKHTVAGAAINLIAEVARLYGIPVANLKREITSFSMLAAVENDNYLMQYRMEKWMLNMNNSSNRSTFTDILYKAYKNDKEAFEIIYADMLEEDKFRRVNDEGEVTTTADYIASALNARVIDDLFTLYKSDQTAYKEMYNDLVKRDFLRKGDKSTADIINDAMETRMKKDQGVDGVTDLEQRYYSPADQIRYDGIMGSVQKSGLWSAATEKQRDNLRGDIHEYLTGDSKAAQEMVEDMNDARNYGIDETEYLLWNLALEMYDTPSDSGAYGSYNTREKADAIAAMTTLSDKEKAYLWSTKTTSDEVWDAFDAGVDIGDYVDFKAGLSELESGVDYKKGDTDSRKRAVNNLLDALGITGADRYWLYHTEYKK